VYKSGQIEEARSYFARAIDRDPCFADAYASLAFSFFSIGGYGADARRHERLTTDIDGLVSTALDLNPRNPTALLVQAGKALEWDWNLSLADQRFRELLHWYPQLPDGLIWYGQLLNKTGRFQEALCCAEHAYRLNPFDLASCYALARAYANGGAYRKSLQATNRLVELYGGRYLVEGARVRLLIELGRGEQAVAAAEENVRRATNGVTLLDLAHALVSSGRSDDAKEIYERALEVIERPDGTYFLALFAHFAGDDSAALTWLDKAIEERDVDCLKTATDTRWGDLHFQTDLQERIRKIGLPLCLEYVEQALAREHA
jgi:tetratricopeptide (TPR) repeat protein